MNIAHALRLDSPSASNQTLSLVGAGGKSTALFQLARQLRSSLVTGTSHLGVWQIPLADRHIIARDLTDLQNLPRQGLTLVTGEIENDRTNPVSDVILWWLREYSKENNIPLLIEADGSRQKSLKAPAAHEPPIPEFTETVIVLAGLASIGKPLTEEYVHRAEIFSQLSGLQIGETITPQAVISVLTHPLGGLKNIPPSARRVVLLNQADTLQLDSLGGGMAPRLLDHFHSVIVGSCEQNIFHTFEHTAAIILAAGEAVRFGSPKQLLDWKGKPFVRHIAETALHSGLRPVVVVTGFHAAEVESCLRDLPVRIVHNPIYRQGQSTSIKAGIRFISPSHKSDGGLNSFWKGQVGAAIFLLADQPQIPIEVIRALTESHARELQPILAPLVLEERRANPVLFDRVTFPDLLQLTGDTGGRAIFQKYKVEYIPWHDDILLLDVDNPEDYQRLVDIEKL
ncbi:MAG: putative selenium-dependent hydroxylase accessory protein YqeC [Anaerolineaceae bacterium]|nr:MAG: putative selenium-dependent hydroxylase accessory protein YqeC [Anaerolineaceae bacterium]